MVTAHIDPFPAGLTSRGPLRIKLATDRRGRTIAYRWAMLAKRWIRIDINQARLMLATGMAVQTGKGRQ